MTEEKLPELWAVEEFCRQTGLPDHKYRAHCALKNPLQYKSVLTGARLIEKYEKPPADDITLLMREYFALGSPSSRTVIEEGSWDDFIYKCHIRKALDTLGLTVTRK